MNILQSGICNIILTAGAEVETMGTFSKGLLNTALGMGTVFVVLIFISILISFFKFIPGLVDIFTKQNKPSTSDSFELDRATKQLAVFEEELEEELVDDLELVAVITAAIMSSMGIYAIDAPADGLFIKSIKRADVKKWQNA